MPGIYDEPEYYEAACAYRDVPAEVDALLRWSGKHREPPRSVLELAAGPAEHARNLARRGLQATALDLNPAMCARARDLAAAAGIPLTVVQADMRDFTLPGPVDLAVTMLNSLCHLLTLDDMLRHLAAVGRHLDRNGLYIMELAHPADYFGAERRTSSEWSSETGDGTVSVRWGAQDQINPVSQVIREHVSVTYHKRGGPCGPSPTSCRTGSGPRPSWPRPSGWPAASPSRPATATSTATCRSTRPTRGG